MDKIKNLLSPGKQVDDEMMYGSGSTGNPDQTTQQAGLTGEGSHFDHTGNAHLGSQNTASEPVRGQPFLSQGNTSGTATEATGIRQESNINQENYRSQESYIPGQSGRESRPMDYSPQHGERANTTSSSDHSRPARQQMPGKYPSGDSSVQGTVHNPYTTHELDPRIGGSTQQASARGEQYTSSTQQPSASTEQYQAGSDPVATRTTQGDQPGQRQKGLNVARTEDYSQEDRTRQSTTDHNYGRDAAIGGGGLATGAAGLAMKHHLAGGESRDLETSGRSSEYSGTNPSGHNDNYYGAPSGTAVSGRRGSAVNYPPPEGAAASGLMTSHGRTTGGTHDSHLARDSKVDSDFDGRSGPHGHQNTQAKGGIGGKLAKVASAVTGGVVGGAAAQHETRGTDYGNTKTGNVPDAAHSGQSAQQGYSGNQYSSGNQAGQEYSSNLRDTQGTSQQYPAQHETEGKHHGLRNTAIGAGAAGVGAHEYREHKDHKAHDDKYDNYTGNDGNVYSQNTTTGKHGADTTRDTHGRDRFYGKEAALAGAGGVAYTETAGTGHAQHGTTHKPYTENEPLSGTHERTGASGPASNTSGPHKSNLMNKLDPSVDSNYAASATTGSRGVSHKVGPSGGHEDVDGYDRHGNRKAVAGAGMPLGDHDATKAYTEHSRGLDNAAYVKTGAGAHSGAHHDGTVGSAHQKPIPLDGIELPRGNQYGQDVKDPRYGLPMSAAGVTAAEAEALRAHDDDLMAKHAARDEKHHGTHKDTSHGTTKEKKRRSSLLGFLHRDKNKKYSRDEEEDFARQEREHNARSGLTSSGALGSEGNPETSKPLPPNPAQQAQTGPGYNQGQQMNLTDRTRHTGDTTSAPAFAGGMVDAQGNPISDRHQAATDTHGEIPVSHSEYARGTGASRNNDTSYGAPTDTAVGDGGAAGSAYPVPGDGRDYPVGNTSGTGVGGDGIHSKVLEKDDGRKVLHKKGHVIHPGAAKELEVGAGSGSGL